MYRLVWCEWSRKSPKKNESVAIVVFEPVWEADVFHVYGLGEVGPASTILAVYPLRRPVKVGGQERVILRLEWAHVRERQQPTRDIKLSWCS